MVSAERLRELLHYDPETGIFRWRNWRTGPAKETAGRPSQRYLQIQVDGRRYQAHRLAILYVTGVWPPDVVDHIDGDGFNNRIANLRSATKSQNLHNRRNPGGVIYLPKELSGGPVLASVDGGGILGTLILRSKPTKHAVEPVR